MLELAALFLAGLALFFHGISGIRHQLQGLTSRRLRREVSQWARRPILARTGGFFFGAITQSATAAAFILTSLVASGLLPVRLALPFVAWANLGTVPLVFFAALNAKLLFLYLLGVAGLAVAFNVGPPRIRPALSALFFVGLVFFGLQLMKEAFAPLPSWAGFDEFAAVLARSSLLMVLAGALLRTVIQSSSAIAVMTVALAHGGLLSPGQAALTMYGTAIGVALSTVLLSSHLRGVPKQIALYQALINGAAGTLLTGLHFFESGTGIPLLQAAGSAVTTGPTAPLAISFLFLQSTSVLIAGVSAGRMESLLARLCPPTREEDLARPRFIRPEALADPESALDLAQAELYGQLGELPVALAQLRGEVGDTIPVAERGRATQVVYAEVEGFLRDLTDRSPDRATATRLLGLEQQLAIASPLARAVHDFAATFGELAAGRASGGATPPSPLLDALLESLDTLLLAAHDALTSDDPADADLVRDMTADRGGTMEALRRQFLEEEYAERRHEEVAGTLLLTTLFERSVWLLHRWVTTRTS